jgi:hypothetical protein
LADGRCRTVQLVGMMVPLGVLQDLQGHTEDPGAFPYSVMTGRLNL